MTSTDGTNETKTRRKRRTKLEVLRDNVEKRKADVAMREDRRDAAKATYVDSEARLSDAIDAMEAAGYELAQYQQSPPAPKRRGKIDESDPAAVAAEIERLMSIKVGLEEDE